MSKNVEPQPLPDIDLDAIISSSNEIAAAATPPNKNIVADPLHPEGIFQPVEPPFANIVQKIKDAEADAEAKANERLHNRRLAAKKNSPLPMMTDVG